jgi:hypothetical protein
MITDNKDGTYTVKFPYDPTHPVTITYDPKAPGESGRDGIWVRVLEQAVAKYLNDRVWFWDKEDNPLKRIDKGDNVGRAIELITGNSYKRYNGNSYWDSMNDWHRALTKAFDERKVVVLVTKPKENPNAPFEHDNGIIRQHAYTVIGYDPVRESETPQFLGRWW